MLPCAGAPQDTPCTTASSIGFTLLLALIEFGITLANHLEILFYGIRCIGSIWAAHYGPWLGLVAKQGYTEVGSSMLYCIVCRVLCSVNHVLCAVYHEPCTMCHVPCTVCAMFRVCCVPCVSCTMCAMHHVLYTVYIVPCVTSDGGYRVRSHTGHN